MNYYTKDLVTNALEQKYAFIQVKEAGNVLTVTLNRPEKKNALHPQMLNEIAFAFQYAKQSKAIWAVVIQANGDVFCAGADLKAFMGMLGEFDSSVPEPEKSILIAELFNKVHKPVITKVEGNVYAGGFFFLAGATYVVANNKVAFALPEVKRGLYPFQVMAALLEVMPKRKVIDWCIRGYSMKAFDALNYGLITHLAEPGNINTIIDKIINDLKENSPSAIKMGLEALDVIQPQENQHKYLMEMLQKTVATKDGQEGLKAFKEKRKPVWLGE